MKKTTRAIKAHKANLQIAAKEVSPSKIELVSPNFSRPDELSTSRPHTTYSTMTSLKAKRLFLRRLFAIMLVTQMVITIVTILIIAAAWSALNII